MHANNTHAVTSVCEKGTRRGKYYHGYNESTAAAVPNNYFGLKSKCRVCKVGCGRESIVGKADTPGFELHAEPRVKYDHRRAQKLCMPRNHGRLNQSSLDLLQTWRGNCDVQVLIYDCDPMHPNLTEIARVTDYVVSYACKGSTSVKEEREQNRNLVLQ
jgi:hypothetical protein